MKSDSETEVRKFRLGDIQPNPHRDLSRYPFNEAKITELIASYEETGVWPNIVARIRDDGRPEIAYGHHRVEAARRSFGEDYEIELGVKNLSNVEMLNMLISENMDESGPSALVQQESVLAVVRAYANNVVKLGAPDPSTGQDKLRHAPSVLRSGDLPFAQPEGADRPYTSTTLAPHLKWENDKIRKILQQLELIEEGILTSRDFEGLRPSHAEAITNGIRKKIESHRRRIRDLESRAQAADKRAQSAKSEGERVKAERRRDKAKALAEKMREEVASNALYIMETIGEDLREERITSRQVAGRVKRAYSDPTMSSRPRFSGESIEQAEEVGCFLNEDAQLIVSSLEAPLNASLLADEEELARYWLDEVHEALGRLEDAWASHWVLREGEWELGE